MRRLEYAGPTIVRVRQSSSGVTFGLVLEVW